VHLHYVYRLFKHNGDTVCGSDKTDIRRHQLEVALGAPLTLLALKLELTASNIIMNSAQVSGHRITGYFLISLVGQC
jgi:hypothetical protein